ncbi:MAG: hypothetical protein ABR581_01680 [Thermoleophilaceae bacterium]
MLSSLALVLGGTAVLAGVTGAWSPCGFSMVDTLAAAARENGRRVLPPALATFSIGALAGGAALFGGLAGIGALLRLGGGAATAVAVAVAAAGAAAEVCGVRIRPQVRRQVPEPWRRVMPLPLAAGLYGVLLGVGFATFVLTLAVVALAAICAALGDPAVGLTVGLGFGLGRLLPVVALAPIAERPAGYAALELMAERPLALRGLRVADGLALAACAAALAGGTAAAATRVSADATDPSTAGHTLAWQRPGDGGVFVDGSRTVPVPGQDPAVGGPFVAWHTGDHVVVARRDSLQHVFDRDIPGVGELAVSGRWLVYRRLRPGGGRVIGARRIFSPDLERHVASSRSGSALGRPSVDGDRVVYHVSGRGGSALRIMDVLRGRRRTLLRSGDAQLLNPSLLGRALVYVRIGRCGQQLVLRRRGRRRVLARGRPLAGQDAGFEPHHTPQGSRRPCRHPHPTTAMFWTTALSARFGYVAVIRPAADRASSSLLRAAR